MREKELGKLIDACVRLQTATSNFLFTKGNYSNRPRSKHDPKILEELVASLIEIKPLITQAERNLGRQLNGVL